MKKATATERTARALRPLMKHAEQRGGITEIQTKLLKATGKEYHRNLIARWLHADEIKRAEPTLGVGLALLEVQREIEGKDAEK